jgi:hypothetical protein
MRDRPFYDVEHFRLAGQAFSRLLSKGATEQQARTAVTQTSYLLLCEQGVSHGEATRLANIEVNLGWKWAQSAFATVVLGHRLAASFCATSIPDDPSLSVPLAWPCFRIRVPDGLLAASSIFCWRGRSEGWQALLGVKPERWKPDGADEPFCVLSIWPRHLDFGYEQSLIGYASKEVLDMKPSEGSASPEGIVGDSYERQQLLQGRLLVGVCLELSQPHLAQQIACETGTRLHRRRQSAEPVTWSFEIRRDVKIDALPYVRDFLAGNASSVHVQSLIRGYHKMQPHGPKSSLRKLIHVEPYWRGPEDAPIAERNHLL